MSTLQAITGWCLVTVAFRETYYYDIIVVYYIVMYTIYFVYQIDHGRLPPITTIFTVWVSSGYY